MDDIFNDKNKQKVEYKTLKFGKIGDWFRVNCRRPDGAFGGERHRPNRADRSHGTGWTYGASGRSNRPNRPNRPIRFVRCYRPHGRDRCWRHRG